MNLLKKVSGVALAMIGLFVTAWAQPDEIAGTPVRAVNVPRPVEPKAQIELDLKLFLNALNGLEKNKPTYYAFGIPSSISGGRVGHFGLNEWIDYFVDVRGKTRFRFDKIEVQTLETDAARVKVFYSLLTPNNIAPVDGKPANPAVLVREQNETLDLKSETERRFNGEGQRWRIVPPSYEDSKRYRSLQLQSVAYYGSQREGTWRQLREQISIFRLEQAGRGAITFTQDYDEVFRFENEFWRDAIYFYIKNRDIFLIPGTQTPYTFNDELRDKNIAQIKDLARTVLFYEGEDEKPIFRYEGRAAIGYADGHVKMVSPEEAKTLIWKP